VHVTTTSQASMGKAIPNSSRSRRSASAKGPGKQPDSDAILHLLAQTETPLLALDAQLHVVWFSAGLQRRWSLVPADLGRSFESLAADWTEEQLATQAREVLEQQQPQECTVRDADGHPLLCRMQPATTPAAGAALLISFLPALGGLPSAVLRAPTERQRLQEAVRAAQREAQEAHAIKDQFLASVSHELRTPLSAIVLWARLLGESGAEDEQQLGEGVTAIKRSAEELRILIDSLVDASRLARGKLKLERELVDLGSIARAALKTARTAAEEKTVGLELELDPAVGTVEADARRLAQVVQQLVNNAVKFTPHGGRVSVRIAREADTVELRVTDTGEGMSAASLSQVFRTGSGDRSGGGLGLGLTVARQLVELHGGSLTARSDGPGRGAVFTARLPLPAVGVVATPEGADIAATRPLEGIHLLLVEDSAETRRALVLTLSGAGASVTAVDSSSKALSAFRQRKPDVIVSDLGLPKMDGYDLLRQFRRWEHEDKSRPVPALALTAYAGERVKHRALESGFQRCLTKPVQSTDLIGEILQLKDAR
jgi:signal transduction histidine kinase/CheY-like chemotaxis protein